jgi:hypothetical protein
MVRWGMKERRAMPSGDANFASYTVTQTTVCDGWFTTVLTQVKISQAFGDFEYVWEQLKK